MYSSQNNSFRGGFFFFIQNEIYQKFYLNNLPDCKFASGFLCLRILCLHFLVELLPLDVSSGILHRKTRCNSSRDHIDSICNPLLKWLYFSTFYSTRVSWLLYLDSHLVGRSWFQCHHQSKDFLRFERAGEPFASVVEFHVRKKLNTDSSHRILTTNSRLVLWRIKIRALDDKTGTKKRSVIRSSSGSVTVIFGGPVEHTRLFWG